MYIGSFITYIAMVFNIRIYSNRAFVYYILYSGRNELLGDTLCMVAALINAIIMVAQDHIVKTRSITEYLGMIGIFGLCISSAQV